MKQNSQQENGEEQKFRAECQNCGKMREKSYWLDLQPGLRTLIEARACCAKPNFFY